VAAGSVLRLVMRYRVYANEYTVRTCHLDGRHGYFNGAALFLYAEGREREPCTVEVHPPPGWRVTTALAEQPFSDKKGNEATGGAGTISFTARDYEELIDSPVEIGSHELTAFEALGKTHLIAVEGRGNLDSSRLSADLRRVVETLGGLMGGLPYERYLFIIHLTDKRRGGLEHRLSTTLHLGRRGFFPREVYEESLALAAHEFFHLWNVKRLRPAAFRAYEYSREQYTRLLWWFEGVTSYYEALALTRAGVGDARRFLRHLGERLTALERVPGARKMSLEEASLLAWVKHYRPDENSGNSSVSYYLKGELVALALDLHGDRASGHVGVRDVEDRPEVG